MEDEKLLSTEQVLLLENLTYLLDESPLRSLREIKTSATPGKQLTIEKILDEIDVESLDDNNDYGSYMTGKDWKNIIQAIRNDDTLLNMKLVETHGDPAKGKNAGENYEETGDGAISALFVNEETGEAVVAFRGTVGYEWGDNFYGGAPTETKDGVSTEYQEKALAWYRSLDLSGYNTITVTGHSKGGNKAKYITLMEQSVGRCLSFDGQGFSDEFIEKYKDRIARYQNKITNHNVDYDFVNLLLNDIGETIYYQGYDYGKGLIAEAHCPNTFFQFDENGNPQMKTVSGQAEEMKVLDEFLNSYLRTVSLNRRSRTLQVIGGLLDAQSATEMAEVILRYDTADVVKGLLEYSVIYNQCHPELSWSVTDFVYKFFFFRFSNSAEQETLEEYWHKIMQLESVISGQAIVSGLYKAIFGSRGEDMKVAEIFYPLEKTRVFDTLRLEMLGRTGKSMMDAGYAACIIWDDAVVNLKELYDSLDGNVKSSFLGNSLSSVNALFAMMTCLTGIRQLTKITVRYTICQDIDIRTG